MPPLPPHITLKDAKNFMTMTLSEPELGSVLKNSAKELLSERDSRQGLNTMRPEVRIGPVRARAFRIPTDAPEADGSFSWTSTTLVVVEVEGGGATGLGYTYTSETAAGLIEGMLAEAVSGADAMDPPRAWQRMQRAVRNVGRDGLAATAISAVDAAVWDLKAKLLDLPLAVLLGRFREDVPIYGSGGFTSYDDAQLESQLRGWVERDGCRWVKMKIGTHPDDDPRRVRVAKRAIGEGHLVRRRQRRLASETGVAACRSLRRRGRGGLVRGTGLL